MVGIKTLKNYLRMIEVFTGSPILETSEFMCADPRGQWEEYYMQYPYWRDMPTNSHESDFDKIQQTLPNLGTDSSKKIKTDFPDTLMQRAIREIPDSSNTLIIELGSEFGTHGAGYIASKKRNLSALLINRQWDDSKRNRSYLFDSKRYRDDHDLRFEKGKEFLSESDIEKKINGIYHANEIHNVTFKKMKLTKNNHQEFFKDYARGRDVYLIGILAPVLLPFIMARLYNTLNAKAMYLAPSAFEKIEHHMFPWQMIQKNLELTNEELQGYIQSVFDPKALEESCSPPKFDYKNPAQKRVGIAMKLGMSLAIAKEVSGTVYKSAETNIRDYNQPDQIIIAQQ